MKGYKGFDKDLKCYGGYQYEIGRTETTDKAELCEAGFHACEHPLDCLNYYEPGESHYCDVDLDDVTDECGEDSCDIQPCSSHISKCCSGKAKTAGGMRWEYV